MHGLRILIKSLRTSLPGELRRAPHAPSFGWHIVLLSLLLLLYLVHCSGLQSHFRRILPEADVEAINAMYTEEAEEQLLAGNPDFVLDAIDNIDTKVALLAACHRRGIPVLSSAGAGQHFDLSPGLAVHNDDDNDDDDNNDNYHNNKDNNYNNNNKIEKLKCVLARAMCVWSKSELARQTCSKP